MNIGYFFWGHLSDKLGEVSKNTPNGNAWYSSSIIHEATKRGHQIFGMSIDRDYDDIHTFGIEKCFNAFETEKRIQAYNSINWINWDFTFIKCDFPDLDILLLEWRFPIEGRNTEKDYASNNWQPDLRMQNILLEYYLKKDTKIIIFDLDHKITKEDELKLDDKNVCIFETAQKPRKQFLKRYSVEIPFWIEDGNIEIGETSSKYKHLIYIGSRYERDESIQKYLVPYSKKNPFTVWFYGNWRNYPNLYEQLYCELKWRDIQYHKRVGHSDFYGIYSDAIACPLIAKQDYYEHGFMTARIQECLYFGTIPIGFSEFYNIQKYLPDSLIVKNSENLEKKIEYIKTFFSYKENKYVYRKQLWENLEFMDVSYFIDKIEEIYNE